MICCKTQAEFTVASPDIRRLIWVVSKEVIDEIEYEDIQDLKNIMESN